MNKKSSGLIAFASGLFISLISFASAQWGFFSTTGIVDSVIRFYREFFGPVFAALFGQYSTNELLFTKVLFFVLLIFVISFVLKKSSLFGERKGIRFLISLIVSLLALRFLPESDLINGVLLPYGVLGVALLTFLPFMIYFFFVYKGGLGDFGRKFAWGLYGVVYLVLIVLRWGEVSSTSQWIYVAGLIMVILAMMLDKYVIGYFEGADVKGFEERARRSGINDLLIRIDELQAVRNPSRSIRDEIREIHDELVRRGHRG